MVNEKKESGEKEKNGEAMLTQYQVAPTKSPGGCVKWETQKVT